MGVFPFKLLHGGVCRMLWTHVKSCYWTWDQGSSISSYSLSLTKIVLFANEDSPFYEFWSLSGIFKIYYSVIVPLPPLQNAPGKPHSINYQEGFHWFGRAGTSVSSWDWVPLGGGGWSQMLSVYDSWNMKWIACADCILLHCKTHLHTYLSSVSLASFIFIRLPVGFLFT